MKKLFILSFAAILALGFASCRKCTTCSRASDNVTTGEVCNSKKEIEAMEEKFQSAEFGYTCVRK